MNASSFLEAYREEGIVVFDQLYSDETIQHWNKKIDSLFSDRSEEERSYVKVEELAELGILQEILTPQLRKMIKILEPSPELYHCHVYEIAGNQLVSHILGHTMDGWHRDADVPAEPSSTGADAFSIFIYLSDVATKSHGAFEFIPRLRRGDLPNGHPTMVLTGQPGRTFFWNRHHYHRANPNSAPVRRRVMKLSVQSAGTENTFLKTTPPETVSEKFLDRDPFIAHLLGAASRGHDVHLDSSDSQMELPAPTPIPESDRVNLGWDTWKRKSVSRLKQFLSKFAG